MADFNNAIRRSLDITAIWKIHIDEISGKCKKLDKDGEETKYLKHHIRRYRAVIKPKALLCN